MWYHRNLFSTCSSGLCNRLLALAGSLRIAEQTKREFSLYWPVNHELGCEFNDLFTNRFSMVTDDALAAILHTCITVKVYNAWKTTTLKSNAISADGDPEINLVIIKAFTYPMFEGEPYCNELFREITRKLLTLTPREEIMTAVRAFSLPDQVVGVHVRRGDNQEVFGASSDECFFALMHEMQYRHPQLRFFVATDSAATEEKFRAEFGDAILAARKSWRPRSEYAGVREGLVDLLLLARTSAIIGTTQSSFGRTAGRLGDIHVIDADEVSAGNGRQAACNVLEAEVARCCEIIA